MEDSEEAGFSQMDLLDNDLPSEDVRDVEEIQEKVCSPREGSWERDLTEALMDISEKLFHDDQKSMELVMGTGWEEAVCGWGPVSATACLHPQKKQRKMKSKDATDCLLCLDMCSVPDNKDGTSSESRGSMHTKHKSSAGQSLVNATPAPAEEELPSDFTGHCPSTAMVSTTESHCDTVNLISSEEQRPNEDRNAQRTSSPFTGRAIPICTNCYHKKDFPMFSSPMSLPPLKVAAGIGHTEHALRRREFLMQQLDKLPSKGFPNNHFLGHTDPKAERRLLEALGELPQDLKVPESLSFIAARDPKTPPVKEPPCPRWPQPLQEPKLNTGNSHYCLKANSYSAPLGFLHNRTQPNKRNIHQDGKCRRAKSDTTPVPRNTILPSLIVTRVDIPPRIKMC
ncbi:uncharacterized protein C16orf46 homolog [Gastrophryne carolinensis]